MAASFTLRSPRVGSWPADVSQDDLANQLLGLAREDLDVAKALKSVLATQGIDFPFTHNITLLMQLCEDAGFTLPADLSEADRLAPYAAAIRYGLGDPEAVAAEDALRWASLAVEWADAELKL